ncbi:hypothetical protein E0Z06_09760 [Rheinheimera sp. D18]|uniref:hypothetical protein n=1 Tax=Rheinheimera sp. D18 TaxID=2545632 RepID=UPI001046C63C|nr:hypothetical protein [Rheinheimera sp. D18]QBL09781.1 hypothetical protein E0Z06_09760 [Rheinheimera sp. D18]
MKNMFKVTLVAAALAGVCSTANAARIDVLGGFLDQNGAPTGYEVLTAANEWLEVNTNLSVSSPTEAALIPTGTHFRIVVEDQYSVDDRIFVTFSGTSIDVASLPLSRTGYIIPTAPSVADPVRGVITIGRIGSTVVDGNTVVEYRVTNVSEGANTQNAQLFFGVTPDMPAAGNAISNWTTSAFKFNSLAVKAAQGVDISYRAEYKNNGGVFDTVGTRRTNVAFIRTGNQLDGNYSGNLTARINTFDHNVAKTGNAPRQAFVAGSGQGRTNEVAYGATFAAPDVTTATTAANVLVGSVGNRFKFEFSTVPNATGWNFALKNADIKTAFTVAGNYGHFLTANNAGVVAPVNGGTVAGATSVSVAGAYVPASGQWGANCFNLNGTTGGNVVADGNIVAPTFPVGAAQPAALKFNCGVGTDFDFGLAVPGAWTPTGVLARQDFNLSAVMSYSGTAGSASKTLNRNIGTWTNDGTTVFVPYMPYGNGISQLLFVTNTGPAARQIAVDVYTQNHNRAAADKFKDAHVLNMNVDIQPGVTRLTEHVRDALIARGVWDGASSQTFAFDFIVSGDTSEIEIYSGYNVNQDRNLVINNSNGRKEIATDSNVGLVRL